MNFILLIVSVLLMVSLGLLALAYVARRPDGGGLVQKKRRMGIRFVRFGCRAVAAWVLLLFVLFVLFGGKAVAQTNVMSPNFWKVYSFTIAAATTNTYTTNNGTSYTVPTTNTAIVTLRQNTGDAWFLQLLTTNASTSNVVVSFDVSPDGNNWTTTQPFSMTGTLNGTNATMTFTNWPANGTQPVLGNTRKIAVTKIGSAALGTVTVNLFESHSNQ